MRAASCQGSLHAPPPLIIAAAAKSPPKPPGPNKVSQKGEAPRRGGGGAARQSQRLRPGLTPAPALPLLPAAVLEATLSTLRTKLTDLEKDE